MFYVLVHGLVNAGTKSTETISLKLELDQSELQLLSPGSPLADVVERVCASGHVRPLDFQPGYPSTHDLGQPETVTNVRTNAQRMSKKQCPMILVLAVKRHFVISWMDALHSQLIAVGVL